MYAWEMLTVNVEKIYVMNNTESRDETGVTQSKNQYEFNKDGIC